MAVARITKKDDGYHVTTRVLGQKHLLRICPKYITAAQIKRYVDTGQYALPTLSQFYRLSKKDTVPIEKGFRDKLLAWLEEHRTMWTTAQLAKQYNHESRLTTGVIRSLLSKEKICRGATQSTYCYGALGVMPIAEDFGQEIVNVLKEHPHGLAQLELFKLTEVHIPLDSRIILNGLIEEGVIKTKPGRRLKTKSRSVGIMYHT